MYSVYVLQLENRKWYVGITKQFRHRMGQHFGGTGAKWTQAHMPIKIHDVENVATLLEARELENDLTLAMTYAHGQENVRGGLWCVLPGTLQNNCNAGKVVEMAGVRYDSIAEAAIAHKVGYDTMRKRIKEGLGAQFTK